MPASLDKNVLAFLAEQEVAGIIYWCTTTLEEDFPAEPSAFDQNLLGEARRFSDAYGKRWDLRRTKKETKKKGFWTCLFESSNRGDHCIALELAGRYANNVPSREGLDQFSKLAENAQKDGFSGHMLTRYATSLVLRNLERTWKNWEPAEQSAYINDVLDVILKCAPGGIEDRPDLTADDLGRVLANLPFADRRSHKDYAPVRVTQLMEAYHKAVVAGLEWGAIDISETEQFHLSNCGDSFVARGKKKTAHNVECVSALLGHADDPMKAELSPIIEQLVASSYREVTVTEPQRRLARKLRQTADMPNV